MTGFFSDFVPVLCSVVYNILNKIGFDDVLW